MFEPSTRPKIKNEFENLLRVRFIRATHYIDCVSNVVPV